MKRLAVALLIAWGTVHAQVVTNPLNRFAIGGIPDCKDARVFCVGKQTGAEYSVACGATPATTTTSKCAAGSALKAAEDSGLCTIATPCAVDVAPGVYPEVVSIDNIKGLNLTCQPGAIFDTASLVTAGVGVDGGALRIGNSTTGQCATDNIRVEGCEFRDWAWNAPEAGCQINREAPGNGVVSAACNITLVGNTCIGAHDGCQWHFGGGADIVDLATYTLIDNICIAAGDPCTEKGVGILREKGNLCVSWSNYAEDATQSAFLEAVGGTVQTGVVASQTVTLAASQGPGHDDFWNGRAFDLYDADGVGAGVCGATNQAVGRYSTNDWNGTTKVLTLVAPSAQTGTLGAGSTGTTFVISSGTPSTSWPDDFPNGRWITLSSGPCSGQTREITDWVDSTNTGTVAAWTACTPGSGNSYSIAGYLGEAPTAGCAYAFQPAFGWEQALFNNRDLTLDRATGTQGGFWKSATHWGATGGTPTADSALSSNDGSTFIGVINDFGPEKVGNTCTAQIYLSGALMYQGDHKNVSVANDKQTWLIRSDVFDNPACPQVGAVFLTDSATVTGDFRYQGAANFSVLTDPTLGLWGAYATSSTSNAGTLAVDLALKVTQCATVSSVSADVGDANTLLLDGADTMAAEGYKGRRVTVTAGTCNGQTRMISNNDRVINSVDVVPDWSGCTPDGTTEYTIEGCTGVGKTLEQRGSNASLRKERVVSDQTITTAGTITLASGADSTGSATLDFGSITSDCVEVVNGGAAATITVPGAAAGDSCAVGVPTASNVLKSSWTCRVSAAATATIRHCCNNGTCDPDSGTFTATVRRQ